MPLLLRPRSLQPTALDWLLRSLLPFCLTSLTLPIIEFCAPNVRAHALSFSSLSLLCRAPVAVILGGDAKPVAEGVGHNAKFFSPGHGGKAVHGYGDGAVAFDVEAGFGRGEVMGLLPCLHLLDVFHELHGDRVPYLLFVVHETVEGGADSETRREAYDGKSGYGQTYKRPVTDREAVGGVDAAVDGSYAAAEHIVFPGVAELGFGVVEEEGFVVVDTAAQTFRLSHIAMGQVHRVSYFVYEVTSQEKAEAQDQRWVWVFQFTQLLGCGVEVLVQANVRSFGFER